MAGNIGQETERWGIIRKEYLERKQAWRDAREQLSIQEMEKIDEKFSLVKTKRGYYWKEVNILFSRNLKSMLLQIWSVHH